LLKPKTDKDCPLCQAQVAKGSEAKTECKVYVIPWEMRKGKGGQKKDKVNRRILLFKPEMLLHLMDDKRIHALIGYGHHEKKERIRDLRCH
jgi:hypothetical protein